MAHMNLQRASAQPPCHNNESMRAIVIFTASPHVQDCCNIGYYVHEHAHKMNFLHTIIKNRHQYNVQGLESKDQHYVYDNAR